MDNTIRSTLRAPVLVTQNLSRKRSAEDAASPPNNDGPQCKSPRNVSSTPTHHSTIHFIASLPVPSTKNSVVVRGGVTFPIAPIPSNCINANPFEDALHLPALIEYITDPTTSHNDLEIQYKGINQFMDHLWKLNHYSGKDLVDFQGMTLLVDYFSKKITNDSDLPLIESDINTYLGSLDAEKQTNFSKSKECIDRTIAATNNIMSKFGDFETRKFRQLLLTFLNGCRDERGVGASEQSHYDSAGTLLMAHISALYSGIKEEDVLDNPSSTDLLYASDIQPFSVLVDKANRLFNDVVSSNKEITHEGGSFPTGVTDQASMIDWAKNNIQETQKVMNQFLTLKASIFNTLSEPKQKMIDYFERSISGTINWTLFTTNRYGLNKFRNLMKGGFCSETLNRLHTLPVEETPVPYLYSLKDYATMNRGFRLLRSVLENPQPISAPEVSTLSTNLWDLNLNGSSSKTPLDINV